MEEEVWLHVVISSSGSKSSIGDDSNMIVIL